MRQRFLHTNVFYVSVRVVTWAMAEISMFKIKSDKQYFQNPLLSK